MAAAVVSFQWFFWGYSLAFSSTAGRFIGDLTHIGLRNVLARPHFGSPKIPDLLYAVYQGMFAAVTYVSLHPRAVSPRPFRTWAADHMRCDPRLSGRAV